MMTPLPLRASATGSKSLRILLAEDNLVNQKLASRLLEKRNHSVTVVMNGREALAALARDAFDLVLMDMQMPEIDGFEATTVLREREKLTGRHQQIIAMTALAMNGDKERCMAAGTDGYLSKPIRPQELDEVLDLFVTPKGLGSTEETSTTAKSSIDVAQLLDRIGDDRSLLAELIDLFQRDSHDNLRAAQRAITSRDAEGLERACHTLRGALANLSAIEASDLAGGLENLGKDSQMIGAQALLDRLALEMTRVTRDLEALRPVKPQ